MDEVGNALSDTSSGTYNVAKGFISDVKRLQFYKNPVFIGFIIYIIVITGIYNVMDDATIDDYIFSNKFRDTSKDINWTNILYYPYDPSLSTASLIKVLTTTPIIWYIVLFTAFFTTMIDPLQEAKKTYFYAVMGSWLVILLLLTIHVMVFNFVIKPQDASIELRLDNPDNKKSYIEFYRTQWFLLIALSPMYVIILLYSIRKLGK